MRPEQGIAALPTLMTDTVVKRNRFNADLTKSVTALRKRFFGYISGANLGVRLKLKAVIYLDNIFVYL